MTIRPLRTIGVIGGMFWESSATYYSIMNREVGERLGGQNSARVIVNSTNLADIVGWHGTDDWAAVEAEITRLAQGLEAAGAACWLIACVTQHEVADAAAKKVGIPLIHIADVTGHAVQEAGLRTVGLLGTKFTMERNFFTGPLRDRYGLDVLLPEPDDRDYLHATIFEDLADSLSQDTTRERYLDIIRRLLARGAEGVILGCTEIPLLVRPEHLPGVPLFDTTSLHALAAVDFSLSTGRPV